MFKNLTYVLIFLIIGLFSINAKSAEIVNTNDLTFSGRVTINNLSSTGVNTNNASDLSSGTFPAARFASGGVSGDVARLVSVGPPAVWEWVELVGDGISASTATGISQTVVGTLTNGAASGTNLSGSVFIDGLIRTVGTSFTSNGSNAVRGVGMTNGTSGWFDGAVNGSNAVGFSRGTTNYWITIP